MCEAKFILHFSYSLQKSCKINFSTLSDYKLDTYQIVNLSTLL